MKGGPEKKFLNIDITGETIPIGSVHLNKSGVAGETITLNDIPQGTGESQRIGRKCTITKILARLEFKFLSDVEATNPNATSRTFDTIRIMLYWDKQ